MKKINWLVLILLLSGCNFAIDSADNYISSSLEDSTTSSSEDSTSNPSSDPISESSNDIEDLIDGDLVAITFTPEVTISGLSSNEYQIENNTITLTASAPHNYLLTGSSSNGRVVFNSKQVDHIYLDNLSLNSLTSAPLTFLKKVDRTLTLIDGSENYLSDALTYSVFDEDDMPNAALFSQNSLFINGKGKLMVNGNYNNGIGSKDTLSISDATIDVTSVNNALKGNDAVIINDANINVNSKEDGIKSDKVDDNNNPLGFIGISQSNINVVSQFDAIQAEDYIHINSGSFSFLTGDGAAKKAPQAEDKEAEEAGEVPGEDKPLQQLKKIAKKA